ncbi:MAG: hypothetical protein FWE09_07600, partial [Treponema sp.]|nr:hypothetical protein [Treponema sp.]
MIANREQIERLNVERLISERGARVNEAMHGLLYRARSLASYVHGNSGALDGFERMAAMLVDDPLIFVV